MVKISFLFFSFFAFTFLFLRLRPSFFAFFASWLNLSFFLTFQLFHCLLLFFFLYNYSVLFPFFASWLTPSISFSIFLNSLLVLYSFFYTKYFFLFASTSVFATKFFRPSFLSFFLCFGNNMSSIFLFSSFRLLSRYPSFFFFDSRSIFLSVCFYFYSILTYFVFLSLLRTSYFFLSLFQDRYFFISLFMYLFNLFFLSVIQNQSFFLFFFFLSFISLTFHSSF